MPIIDFNSPYYPYEKVQTGYNTFNGAEQIPYKILLYLLDLADASGYVPADDNSRPRVKLVKYLWNDGERPLDGPLPTDAEKLSLLFRGDQPDINTDAQKAEHPKGYRIYAQPYWLPSAYDARTILKCYVGKVSPYTPFRASVGLTFEIVCNYAQAANTRTDAFDRAFAMECAIISALDGVNITGVGTVTYNRAEHPDAGSRVYHDEGTHVYRVLNLSLDWMDSDGLQIEDSPITPTITIRPLIVTENGDYVAPENQAYNPVRVSVQQKPELHLTVTANGEYTPPQGSVYNGATIAVENTYTPADEGKVVDNGALVAQTALSVDENGEYDTTQNNKVTVAVPTTTLESAEFTANGDYTPAAGKAWNQAHVAVPNTYTAGDEGKVVSNSELVAQTARTVTANDTYDTTLNNSVTVAIPSKTEDTLTATQNGVYTPAAGHVFSEAIVNVPWLMQGPNPVENLGVVYDKTIALKDTGYASWTPSTTQFTIQATSDAQAIVLNTAQYEYFAVWEFDFVPVYSDGTPMVAAVSRVIGVLCGSVSRRQNTVASLQAGVFDLAANVTMPVYGETVYYGTNGAIALYSGLTAGVYVQSPFPTISNPGSDTPTLTLKTPPVAARCDAARFSTSSASAIDQDKSKFTLRCTLYRTPIGGASRQIYAILGDLYNNPIV